MVASVQASVAYYLMSDNRRRMPSSAYLRAEMTETSDTTTSRHAGKSSSFAMTKFMCIAMMGWCVRLLLLCPAAYM